MNKERFASTAESLFNTHSPSGNTDQVITLLMKQLTDLGLTPHLSKKGNVIATMAGKDPSKSVALSAHVDTLGLMVRSIKSSGTLALTNIGGPIVPTLDGEYCIIQTREGKTYSGTILSTSPSSHVYEDFRKERKLDTIEVRIDEKVSNVEDVKKLGINHGDFVFIDPKFVITPSGFIKSRFIDDKGSVAALLETIALMNETKQTPHYTTHFYFVVHEEVGHGAATLDNSIDEFIAVDMGCIGSDLAGNEFSVSIAAKDSGGPYDYELTNRLIHLAKDNNIKYVIDIFPFYGSDVSAAWRAGHDFKGALIGPGVHASHGMERTHLDAIEHTISLVLAYLTK